MRRAAAGEEEEEEVLVGLQGQGLVWAAHEAKVPLLLLLQPQPDPFQRLRFVTV